MKGKQTDTSVSFIQVLDAAGIDNASDWDLEIDKAGKLEERLTVINKKTNARDTKIVRLTDLKGRTLMNVAANMVKALNSQSRNGQQPRNAQDFFDYAKANDFRIVREFQDGDKQWVVYENPDPKTAQRNETKPEPDYWVTGDELDWQPGYQFNGSRWLIQKIKLEENERLVIQKAVHEDIKQNQFEFTGMKNPFTDVKRLVAEPTYDSTWRLYQDMDGKIKHWVDIINQGAYDRYYYKGEPLYFIAERVVDDKGPLEYKR